MPLHRLILKELWHRKANGLLSLLAVTATVALFVAFFTTAQASKRETVRVTRDIGFNVRIISRETDMEKFWADGFSDRMMPAAAAQRLADYKNVFFAYNHLVATLQQRFDLQGHRIILAGVSPAITAPDQRNRPMGYSVKPGTIIVGAEVAKRLGLKSGGSLEIAGRNFTVERCLVESGTAEDVTIYGALPDVQRSLNLPGQINEIKAIDCLCLTTDQEPLRRLRTELEKALPEAKVIQLRAIADARARQRQESVNYFNFITPLLLAICAAWVMVLAVQNVRERRVEIGVLRALGYSSGKIAGLFLGKAVLLGLVGAVCGYLLGTALALHFGPAIFKVTAASIQPELSLLLWAGGATPAFAALVSFIPAMLAVTTDPAETLRET